MPVDCCTRSNTNDEAGPTAQGKKKVMRLDNIFAQNVAHKYPATSYGGLRDGCS